MDHKALFSPLGQLKINDGSEYQSSNLSASATFLPFPKFLTSPLLLPSLQSEVSSSTRTPSEFPSSLDDLTLELSLSR